MGRRHAGRRNHRAERQDVARHARAAGDRGAARRRTLYTSQHRAHRHRRDHRRREGVCETVECEAVLDAPAGCGAHRKYLRREQQGPPAYGRQIEGRTSKFELRSSKLPIDMPLSNRRAIAVAVCALGATLLSSTPRAQIAATVETSATVEGVVVSAGNGQPLAGARVELFLARPPEPSPGRGGGRGGDDPLAPDPDRRRSATTAQDGRFLFDQLKPGEYRLLAMRTGGWVPGEFGQRSPTSTGTAFELTVGQQMRGVQIVLTPTASISGRVYDPDGALGKVQVQALRPAYRDGHRALVIIQSVLTDDR